MSDKGSTIMWCRAGVAILFTALTACAGSQSPPGEGVGAASVIGTPFLIAFKIPVCAATVVLAAPLAGATGLAPTVKAYEIRRDLDQGVAQNCGPPYVLGAD
jgi:hypothetical protein